MWKEIVGINPLPLILHLVDPIAVCIIDDIMIGCEPYENVQQSPKKSYNFLNSLYENPISQKELPDRFVDHFKKNKSISSDSVFTSCFGGTDDSHGGLPCIDFSIDLNDGERMSIVLKDFIYGKRSRNDFISMNFEVKLSTFEAFLIFSNICANNLIYWWWDLYDKDIQEILDDKQKIQALIKESIRGKEQYNLHLFSMGYLYYLKTSLEILDITPLELLRLNGAPVLSLFSQIPVLQNFNEELFKTLLAKESIPENTKVVCYSYIKHLEYTQNKSFMTFQKNNPDILTDLEKEVTCEFATPFKLGKRLEKLFVGHKN